LFHLSSCFPACDYLGGGGAFERTDFLFQNHVIDFFVAALVKLDNSITDSDWLSWNMM
jgi:hypothetical protein